MYQMYERKLQELYFFKSNKCRVSFVILSYVAIFNIFYRIILTVYTHTYTEEVYSPHMRICSWTSKKGENTTLTSGSHLFITELCI